MLAGRVPPRCSSNQATESAQAAAACVGEWDRGSEPGVTGIEQRPDHATPEAEPDRTEGRARQRAFELVQARSHVIHKPLESQGHESGAREAVSHGADVIGEAAVLVDDQDAIPAPEIAGVVGPPGRAGRGD